ncbi:MAG: hypothetical protein WBW67_19265, partial [Pseudolabrys sp.]
MNQPARPRRFFIVSRGSAIENKSKACIRQTELESTLPLAQRNERQSASDKAIGSNKDPQQPKL